MLENVYCSFPPQYFPPCWVGRVSFGAVIFYPLYPVNNHMSCLKTLKRYKLKLEHIMLILGVDSTMLLNTNLVTFISFCLFLGNFGNRAQIIVLPWTGLNQSSRQVPLWSGHIGLIREPHQVSFDLSGWFFSRPPELVGPAANWANWNRFNPR